MINNEKDFRVTVKAKLKEIKECNLDIAILRRRLDDFSSQNFIERNNKKYNIEDLTNNIEKLEIELERDLTASKGTKIDTQMGYVNFKGMPDEWIYNIPKIMDFLKTIPEKISQRFTQVTTILQKAELKKAIIADNASFFEKSKITDAGMGVTLILEGEGKGNKFYVEGIEIKRQEPKFHYRLKE